MVMALMIVVVVMMVLVNDDDYGVNNYANSREDWYDVDTAYNVDDNDYGDDYKIDCENGGG